jgi:ATP-dependent Clp protease ATP-binding subunit ClpC
MIVEQDLPDMANRYTDRARRVVELARLAAQGLNHSAVGTDHLLLGLIGEGGGVAFTALSELGVTIESASEAVCRHHPAGDAGSPGYLPLTLRLKKTLELALREALQLGHNFVGTEHLLLGLIREGDDVGALALADCGVAEGDKGFLADVRAKVHELLRGYAGAEKRAAVPPSGTLAPVLTGQQAFAWELVIRMRKFLGHVEDMGADERLFMLGALTGSLEGILRDAGVPEPPNVTARA